MNMYNQYVVYYSIGLYINMKTDFMKNMYIKH